MPETRELRAIDILLVEDSPTDRLLTIEALERSNVINSLHVVENGVEAMAYLRREGKFSAAPRPDIILLDLNLPKKDGREVLAEIKADPWLKFIPVIVLTTSHSDEDLLRAYGNHANSYITKPVDLPRFAAALRALGGYWFEVVTLPPEAAIERLARAQQPRFTSSPDPLHGAVRVLLIEDNPTDALLLRESLAESASIKFELTHVRLIAEARECLRTQSFDLVMTDLGLSDSRGLDSYRQVRSFASGLPVIVLTGLDDEAAGTQALREGAHDYLVKGELTPRALARAARYAIEKRQHQEQLRQAQKLEAVGRLAAGVAHDFNNILTVVRANAELLAGAGTLEDVRSSAQEIQEAADRASGLARQLLAFTRQQAMHAKAVDLNQVVGDFTRMLKRLLGESVGLELQLAQGLPAIVADIGMIEQVLLNLAVNGRDAMPGGGKLRVETAAADVTPATASGHAEAYAGRFARLIVSDTGAGMPAEVLARLFEPFFTTKPQGQGTGLGLATVHGIIQQHRGWLNVTSRVGAGTRFEIFLPTTTVVPALPAPAAARSPTHDNGTETILIVEDEAILRRLAVRVLRLHGYEVLEAGSGAEALAVWAERGESVDLLFTDMVLPGQQTGRQLAEILLRARPSLPIIFTSGYSPDFGKADFVLDESVNFLQKPYQISTLLNTVRRRLDARRPDQALHPTPD
jgi:two-component system, cell cycle sensor histidine kinase and response regulator CckA